MHPELLKRIANWSNAHPGFGLPEDRSKMEAQLDLLEATQEFQPLAELLGHIAIRYFLLDQAHQVVGTEYEEACIRLEPVAVEQSNDLTAELDAYSLSDDPEREEPMTLAGLMSDWLSSKLY